MSKGGLGGNSGVASEKCVGLFSQTSELLCSSSLEGRAKKSGGKVPLTSFLQPHRGLRRGRARFPGKHRAGLGGRLRPACGTAGRGAEQRPPRRPRAPPLHPSSRKRRLERPGCSAGSLKPRGKPAAAGAQPGVPGSAAERPPPPCKAARAPAPRAPGGWPNPAPHDPARGSRPRAPAFPSPHARASAAEGAPSPRLTCALDPGAAGRGAGCGAQASAARRLKLCCSRDGAVVTSSRSGRRGPACDPAARAVARRALQRPARAPALRAPGGPGADSGSARAGLRGAAGGRGGRPPSLHPAGSLRRGRNATEPVFSRLGFSRPPPRAGVPGGNTPTPQTKRWGWRKRKFSSFALKVMSESEVPCTWPNKA